MYLYVALALHHKSYTISAYKSFLLINFFNSDFLNHL